MSISTSKHSRQLDVSTRNHYNVETNGALWEGNEACSLTSDVTDEFSSTRRSKYGTGKIYDEI